MNVGSLTISGTQVCTLKIGEVATLLAVSLFVKREGPSQNLVTETSSWDGGCIALIFGSMALRRLPAALAGGSTAATRSLSCT
jgi:hypothetical protein